MTKPIRTAAEQRIWDALFAELVLECVRQEGFAKAMGCLHLCAELADAAMVERRKSVKGEKP